MMRTLKVPFLATLHEAYKVGAFALGAVVLFGCPVYSSSSGGNGETTCDSQGNCCDQSGNCAVWNCDYDEQCPVGAECDPNQLICVSPSDGGYGYDGGYDYDASYGDGGTDATVDCSETGCPTGYQCTLTNGVAQCLSVVDASLGDASKPGTDASVDAKASDAHTDTTTGPRDGTVGDGGVSDATDAHTAPPFTGCTSDNACVADAGAGARCLDGKCVAEADQCSDTTQCPIVGTTQEQCVQGVCTPSCAGGAVCPTGYACDTSQLGGVCTINPTPCGAATDGGSCAAGTTCVDEHCVPLCATTAADAAVSDAGPCGQSGLVCVDNGCIPDQTPRFVCANDGQEGAAASTCAGGSICLHHNCYITCTPGDASTTCKNADNFNVCKPVATPGDAGTAYVCGSSTNLGTQCDPTTGLACPNSFQVCIDGYCY
jgi:hypothetical protein